MLVLSKGHDSTPRVGGAIELLASGARTADVDVPIYIGNGVKQLYMELDCTVYPAAAIVTPELFLVLPSGALVSLGTGEPATVATGSFRSAWGLVADAQAVHTKVVRIMIEGMNHVMRFNHTDADSITYSAAAFVFGEK